MGRGVRTVALAVLVLVLAVVIAGVSALRVASAASTPPAPSVTGHPANPTTRTTASFTFSDTQSGASFVCSLDRAAFRGCRSPVSYYLLAFGSHTFAVEAVSAGPGPTRTSAPTRFTWKVIPKTPVITQHPANPTTATIATFSVADSQVGVRLACALDGGYYLSCTSPVSYSGLSLGSHTFSVEAVKGYLTGAPTSVPATFTWKVVPPTPTITGHPTNPTTATTAHFTYTDTLAGVTYQCSLDAHPYAACPSSGVTYNALSLQPHTFSVEALSGHGLQAVASAPATFAWTVGRKATTTTLTLSTTTAKYGSENVVIASGKVTGQPGSGVPIGTVTVTATTGTTLCTIATFPVRSTADTTTFGCNLPATGLAASATPHHLTATFTPPPPSTSPYAGSTSTPARPLSVSRESLRLSGITFTISPRSVTYGDETTVTFSGKLTGQTGKGNPTGTVSVEASVKSTPTVLCTSSLTATGADAATYHCTLTPSFLTAGNYTVVVGHYTGGPSSDPDYSYEPLTPEAQTLTVRKITPTFTIAVKHTSIAPGATAQFSETGIVATAPGSVAFTTKNDTTTLCTATLPTTTCTTATTLHAGSYTTIKGHYISSSNDYADATSSNAVTLSVVTTAVGTTTSLSLTPSSVTFGTEENVSFTGTVTGAPDDGYPQGGTVTVTTTTGTVLCTGASVTGPGTTGDTATFSCSVTTQHLLTARGYSVTASYSGGPSSTPGVTYTPSTTSSSPQSLTVTKVSSSTFMSLNLSTHTVQWGTETQVTFTGAVYGGTDDGYPVGTVKVTSTTGATLCTDRVDSVGTTSYYSCSIPSGTAKVLGHGPHTITATYTPTPITSSSTGNATYSGSMTTATLTVEKLTEGTRVAFRVTPTTVTYGTETQVTVTGTVLGVSRDGAPVGSVAISVTGTFVCTQEVSPGSTSSSSFSCPLTTTARLLSGNSEYTVTVTFTPTPTSSTTPNVAYGASGTTATLYVTPAYVTPTVQLDTITATVTFGTETNLAFSGTVTDGTGDGAPVGTVVIYATGTELCTATLSPSGGTTSSFTCSPTSGTALTAGTYTVTAYYEGTETTDASFSTATSSSQSLTVNEDSQDTSVTLRVSPTITYLPVSDVTLSGTVKGVAGHGAPQGTVSIATTTSTHIVVCTAVSLTTGTTSSTFSCQATGLVSPNLYHLVATYTPSTPGSSTNPSVAYKGSASPPESLTVTGT